MQIIVKKVPENFNLFLGGDEHFGSVLCYEKGIKLMVERIGTPIDGFRNYYVDHGDQIEAVKIDDPRFRYETTKILTPSKQKKGIVELLKPIKKQIVVLMEGNHPMKLWRYGPLVEEMAEELGTEYGTYTCVIYYVSEVTGKLFFKHYVTHGYGPITSRATPRSRAKENMSIKLQSLLQDKATDCYLMSMGHTHRLIVRKPQKYLNIYTDKDLEIQERYSTDIKIAQNQSFIPEDFRWYVNTGCFRLTLVKGITDYAEVAGYDPLQLGYALATVREGRLVKVEEVPI